MLYMGATGETSKKLRQAANLPKISKEKLQKLMRKIIEKLNEPNSDVSLIVTNAIYADLSFTVKPEFSVSKQWSLPLV